MGPAAFHRLRGMFAFAIWDDRRRASALRTRSLRHQAILLYAGGKAFVFASEAKALLPFLPDIETDPAALAEYLTFQYTIGARTLFEGIDTLLPGHALAWRTGRSASALLGRAVRG